MPDIIAVRRNLTPGAVFFRQRGTRLEYSLDNVNWHTAYNFASAVQSPIDATDYQTFVDNFVTPFDGTVNSVAPEFVYTGTGADFQRDRIMCQALRLWINAIVEGARLRDISPTEELATGFDGAAATFGLATVAALGTPIPGIDEGIAAFLTALFVALSWVTRTVGGSSIIVDDENIERVQCCVYDALAGQTPSPANLATALDPDECGFAVPNSAERAIFDTLNAAVKDKQAYLSLLGIAAGISEFIRDDVDCPCSDVWSVTVRFDGLSMPDNITITNAAGMVHQPYIGWFTSVRRLPTMDLGESFNIIGLTAEYQMTIAAGSTSPQFRLQLPGVTAPAFANFEDNSTGLLINWTKWLNAPLAINGTMTLDMRPATVGVGNATLKKLVFYGKGANPFD